MPYPPKGRTGALWVQCTSISPFCGTLADPPKCGGFGTPFGTPEDPILGPLGTRFGTLLWIQWRPPIGGPHWGPLRTPFGTLLGPYLGPSERTLGTYGPMPSTTHPQAACLKGIYRQFLPQVLAIRVDTIPPCWNPFRRVLRIVHFGVPWHVQIRGPMGGLLLGCPLGGAYYIVYVARAWYGFAGNYCTQLPPNTAKLAHFTPPNPPNHRNTLFWALLAHSVLSLVI